MSEAVETSSEEPFTVVVISGVRGSGRTLSLRLLEDCGYTGIDNLPPAILPQLVDDSLRHKHDSSLVVVVETRTSESVQELEKALTDLQKRDIAVSSVFLDASSSTLLDRLGLNSGRNTNQIVEKTRVELLENRRVTLPLRDVTDFVMDTSRLSPVDLKERLIVAVEGKSLVRTMNLEISSFGFKYSSYAADLVFDVRFIPNPYYVSELRPLTGKDSACAAFVFQHKEARMFVETISDLIKNLIPAYIAQGRSVLHIGIGCTGGHHRSVAVAEALGEALKIHAGLVTVRHRELTEFST